MTNDAKLTNLIDASREACIRMRAVGLVAQAGELEDAVRTFADTRESRPIVGDRVKICGGEFIGFTGTYVADRDNGSARYPVVRLADGRETFVLDPLHLRKL